ATGELLVARIAGRRDADVAAARCVAVDHHVLPRALHSFPTRRSSDLVAFLAAADKFVDLQEHGGDELKDRWLPWVWDKATTADGSTTIGYGTDVGGLAMCYRRDLFEKAGLPTERDEVGALWPTWDDFIATGKKFQAGIDDDKVGFIDSSTNT